MGLLEYDLRRLMTARDQFCCVAALWVMLTVVVLPLYVARSFKLLIVFERNSYKTPGGEKFANYTDWACKRRDNPNTTYFLSH